MPAYVGATLARTRKLDADVKPKKLILSRKGFDSGSGGCPSPIFPDGTMFSLPIPFGDREQFDDLQHGDVNIASVVTGITNGRLNGRDRIHLDPDSTSTRTGTGKTAPLANSGGECSARPASRRGT